MHTRVLIIFLYMQEKKKEPVVSKRNISFFGGIAICLFSVILILNVGYFARAIAFPFIYLFGLGSYLVYIFAYSYGLFLFFREKGFKIRLNNYFFGALIIFIAALMISTLIIVNPSTGNELTLSNCVSKFHDVFLKIDVATAEYPGSWKNYWNSSFVNLFQGNKFGGGLAGYFLVALCWNTLKTGGTWAVAIIVLLFGLFLLFFPVFKKAIVGAKGKEKKPLVKEESMAIGTQVKSVNSNAIISNASTLEPAKPVIRQEPTPVSSTKTVESPNKPVEFKQNEEIYTSPLTYSGTSNFAPAVFAKFALKPANTMVSQTVEPVAPAHPMFEESNRSTVNEQMSLDFNAKPEINEELVTAKPEFIEPVNAAPRIVPEVRPVAQVNPQPVAIEQPVVKKPVKWVPPSSELLETLEVQSAMDANNAVAQERMVMINAFFEEFNVGAKCNTYVVGPAVTRYNIEYGTNVSVKRVEQLVEDLSIRLGGVTARFASVVEGKNYSGLEIPNAKITSVSFKEVFESLPDVKKHPLSVAFGKNIDSEYISRDFNDFPHVLVAGTTGSGKSIFTHSVVSTLIMRNSPDDLRLVLIDPKKVEMNKYRDLPHLLCPIINDANIAKLTMSKLCDEMNRRYEVLMNSGVSNIQQYNELLEDNPKMERLPYIVVIVDEYADLVDTCKDIKQPVVSIAQKARAAGIHMLIATQRPSTNVIDGVIKGNLPTRVALAVASYTDSMTILGLGGGEKLLGRGDMLVQSPLINRSGAVRLQGCYIQNKEINRIVGYLKEHYECVYDPNFCNLEDAAKQEAGDLIGSPEFAASQEGSEEAKYQSVKEWVMANEYMSMSRIQRECGVGFNRAGRFFKRLQDEGVVDTQGDGNKGCKVLVSNKFYEGSAESDIPVSLDQSE